MFHLARCGSWLSLIFLPVLLEYLFKVKKETGKARLDTMLQEVKDQLQLHPGFRVFVTGHSLGAALATLFGFYAASDDDILSGAGGQSVVVYSVASPFVGNWKFRHAFQELERRKRLQHLRIANLEDMVTLLPFCAPKATVLSPALSAIFGAGNLYKHCGMKLQFRGDPVIKVKDLNGNSDSTKTKEKSSREPTFSLSFPKDRTNDDEYAKELQDALEAGKSLASAFYYMLRKDFDKLKAFHRYGRLQPISVNQHPLRILTLLFAFCLFDVAARNTNNDWSCIEHH
jgi:hypothetical protein